MNATTTVSDQNTLLIAGMSCGHCVQAVTNAISIVPGVKVRAVAIGSAEIDVTSPTAASDAVAALDRAGYSATFAQRATTADAARLGGWGGRGGCCGGAQGRCG